MKHIFIYTYIAIVAIMSMALSSCTHNNGDIGVWFGQWKVSTIIVDGKEDKTYIGNIFFAFQSNVIKVARVYDTHDEESVYGTWSEDSDNLIVTYYGVESYPLNGTYMTMGDNVMHINNVSDKQITLTMVTTGHSVTYKLDKW